MLVTVQADFLCRDLLKSEGESGRIRPEPKVLMFGVNKMWVFIHEIVLEFDEGHGYVFDVESISTEGDITPDDIAAWLAWRIFEDVDEARIFFAPWRLLVRHFFKSLRQRAVRLDVVFHPADSPGIDVNRCWAIHENVILDEVVPAAPDEGRLARAVEYIADDGYSACRIVEVHGHGAIKARSFDIVKIVVAYNCSPCRPVAAHIKGPDVTSLKADVIYFVKLDHVVVSIELDCIVGAIVNHIVRDVVADAADGDGGPISSVDASEVMYVVVFRAVPRGCQDFALAPA
jgi:hypothetical protein